MAWRQVTLTEFCAFVQGKTAQREIGQPVQDQNGNRRLVNAQGDPIPHHGGGADWYEVTFTDTTKAKAEGIWSGPPGLFVWDTP